jgi:membrane protein implicated in regulation of membrane protease activity
MFDEDGYLTGAGFRKVLVVGCTIIFIVGFTLEGFTAGLMAALLLPVLLVMVGFVPFHTPKGERIRPGFRPAPPRPEHAPYIGRRAQVTAVTGWGLLVSLDGVEGPARLPPFTPPPPPGSVVIVEAVADNMLVVRPETQSGA